MSESTKRRDTPKRSASIMLITTSMRRGKTTRRMASNSTPTRQPVSLLCFSAIAPTRSTLLTVTIAYLVDSLPDVNFDVGELYGGLVPIDASNASRALFMMFQPTVGAPVDEVTIWYESLATPHDNVKTDMEQVERWPRLLQLGRILPGERTHPVA